MDEQSAPTGPTFQALNRVLFDQLTHWFASSPASLADYEKLSLVGPRRKNLESLLCLKKKALGKYVLKSFANLDQDSAIPLVAYELLVPLMVDHPMVLKNSRVFVDGKVRSE